MSARRAWVCLPECCGQRPSKKSFLHQSCSRGPFSWMAPKQKAYVKCFKCKNVKCIIPPESPMLASRFLTDWCSIIFPVSTLRFRISSWRLVQIVLHPQFKEKWDEQLNLTQQCQKDLLRAPRLCEEWAETQWTGVQKATVPGGSSCTSSPTYLPALGQHCRRLFLHCSLQEHSGMRWFEPICGTHSAARFPFFFLPPVRQNPWNQFLWAKYLMWQI